MEKVRCFYYSRCKSNVCKHKDRHEPVKRFKESEVDCSISGLWCNEIEQWVKCYEVIEDKKVGRNILKRKEVMENEKGDLC